MIKKILTYTLFILIFSCGYQPMYKNFNISKLNIKKINYLGNKDLTYLLKSYLGLNENVDEKGNIINLTIIEYLVPATKNSTGITVEEDLTIKVIIEVKSFNEANIYNDDIAETRRLTVSNNLSNDETIKNNEKINIVKNLSQKIKFKLLFLASK